MALKRLLIGVCVVAVAGAAVMAWRLRPQRRAFYTDADTIRETIASAAPRDILWQPPRMLPAGINTSADDYEPGVSDDGLTLFFTRGKAGNNADIYVARRTLDGWTEPEPLTAINSDDDDLGAAPSRDGRTLYFYSNRPGGLGGYDLWVARQGAQGWIDAPAPVNLGPEVNSGYNDYGPAPTPDGTLLYFASNRPLPHHDAPPLADAWPATLREDLWQRDYDLYVVSVADGQPDAAAEPLAALNTAYSDGAPAVSPVGDFLYFASDRPGGQGRFDLYRSRRLRGDHQPPTNLGATVNTAANELDPALTLGGFALYFSSDRTALYSGGEGEDHYDLFTTTSREVFLEHETAHASFDWGALWFRIGPNLLWALLALLLLLLLLALMRDATRRKLSLLARCLLASLMLHLVLLFLLNFWEVTVSVAEAWRGRRPVQVALVGASESDELFAQIRGNLTQVNAPAPTAVAAPRPAAPRPIPLTAVPAEIGAARYEVDNVVPFERPTAPADARLQPPETPQPAPPTPIADADAADVSLPGSPARAHTDEADAAATVAPVQPVTPQRARQSDVVSALDAAEILLAPQPTPTVENATTSLAAPSTTVDAAQQLRKSLEPPVARISLEPTTLPPVALPSDAAEPSIAQEATATLAPSAAPRRRSLADVPLTTQPATAALTELVPRATATRPARTLVQTRGEQGLMDAPQPASTSDRPQAPDRVLVALPKVPLSLPRLEEAALAPTRAESSAQVDIADRTMLRASPPARDALRAMASPRDLADFAPEALAHARRRSVNLVDRRQDDRPVVELDASPALAASPLGLSDSALTDPLPFVVRVPAEHDGGQQPYMQRAPDYRPALVNRMGGSDRTERAVAQALVWLAAHQRSDGRWDARRFDRGCGQCDGSARSDVDHAVTGLALLSFLGADHTHVKPGPYQEVVRRSLIWLLSQQESSGKLYGNETMYSHGIATIALAEAYGMTGDPDLAGPVRRAVAFIDRARSPRGGWRYDPRQPGDTSVLGWQIMALKSAELAGIDVPPALFAEGARWLDRVSRPSRPGEYGYQPGRQFTPAMTAEGMFTQQLLGHGPDEPRMQASAEYLMKRLPDWDNDRNNNHSYYWYYATLALFQHQGPEWERWNDTLTEELLAHQSQRQRSAGSWAPVDRWAVTGGRVYQTALCTLMLEVYYRYLPLYATPLSQPGAERRARPGTVGAP